MVDRKAFRRFQPEAALPSDTQSKDVQPTYGAAIANGECLDFYNPSGSNNQVPLFACRRSDYR